MFAQEQLASSCGGQLSGRQPAMALHHPQKVDEALLPTFVDFAVTETSGEGVGVGRQRG
jgi:hypothetical protein